MSLEKWKTKDWALVSHKNWAFIADDLLSASVIVGLFTNYWLNWFQRCSDSDLEEKLEIGFGIQDKRIFCSKDQNYCYYKLPKNSDIETSRDGVFLGWFIINAGLGITALSWGILSAFLGVAYYTKQTRRVVLVCLRVTFAVSFIGAYSRFAGIFIVINHMRTVNHNFMHAPEKNTVQIETLPVGLSFVSFVLEVLALVCLRVAFDDGALGGESHLDRLQREAQGDGSVEDEVQKYQREHRRSSYLPASMGEEHESVLKKVENWKKGSDGTAVADSEHTENKE